MDEKMSESESGMTIGIDRGASFTDFGVVESGRLVHALSIEKRDWDNISFLGSDMTASNFAAVQSRRTEDLAAAILRLAGETVGIIASICARETGCMDEIVMVGKVAQNRFIRQTIHLVGKLYQTSFVFPDEPGYATVYGAAIKSEFDKLDRGKDGI